MTNQPIVLPAIAALAASAKGVALLSADGEISSLGFDRAGMAVHQQEVLCCYAPYIRQRLGDSASEFYPLDVMELFAFVHPATFCIPTPYGLCDMLGLDKPATLEDTPFSLFEITRTLLEHLRHDALELKAPPLEIARAMGLMGRGWGWTPYICEALGEDYESALAVDVKPLLSVIKNMPEWEEQAPRPPPSHYSVSGDEAEQRLDDLLRGADTSENGKIELRPQQKAFTRHIARCFDTAQPDEIAPFALAEAGTGTGKTLGYLAPSSVWAEKNDGAVWISTYTKNLQRQIDGELDRLYPRAADKEQHVAVRKGRENYLCLLNLHESAAAMATVHSPHFAVAAGLMLRWIAASPDGDLSGAAFPGWLSGLLGFQATLGLADRRGECIYSACDHYKRCFSERSIRKAKHARIVIANHALVMIQAALSSGLEELPSRYIFDEGHHLFSAADSAFCLHLTAQETRDLRRWILGPEGGRRGGRARGLQKRIEDLCGGDEDATQHLMDILQAAQQLTSDSWTRRMKNGSPKGAAEEFLHCVMGHVYARENADSSPYSLETPLHPVGDDLAGKAKALGAALRALQKPMKKLAAHFIKMLQDDGLDVSAGDQGASSGLMDSDTRKRVEAVATSLESRSSGMLQGWIEVLDAMQYGASAGSDIDSDMDRAVSPHNSAGIQKRVDWMEVTRVDGQAVDLGVFSHWVDPMHAFAGAIEPHLQGMAVTSATLRDKEDAAQDADQLVNANLEVFTNLKKTDWSNALRLSGASYLNPEPDIFSAHSPFDYAARSKVIIVQDVNKNDAGQVAGAYLNLFKASGGSALGLLTAIGRLRAVHGRINSVLEDEGIPLYAQHVDAIDTGTLIDMFRYDKRSCMLGTDATRDGVDVPGESLKLLVFDRTPWPRPTILHKARRDHFGGRSYDEMMTRLKLKQAFGRLIRRADDKGVFVMLDSALPSRLHSAFPAGTEIIKCGLSEACDIIRGFLGDRTP